jgi:hypothetical protein
MRRLFLGMAVGAALLMACGCAGLSLFSSTHTHYHKDENTEKRIESLEKRVDALERR